MFILETQRVLTFHSRTSFPDRKKKMLRLGIIDPYVPFSWIWRCSKSLAGAWEFFKIPMCGWDAHGPNKGREKIAHLAGN